MAPRPPPQAKMAPPSWIILSNTPLVSDTPLPQGSPHSLKLEAPPRVSLLTVAPWVSPNNGLFSIDALDPSGLLLLFTGPTYFVLDVPAATMSYRLPGKPPSVDYYTKPGVIADPAAAGAARAFVLADFHCTFGGREGNDNTLVRYWSRNSNWRAEDKADEVPDASWAFDDVVSHDGRIWWIDTDVGLVTCSPFRETPPSPFRYVPLPDVDKGENRFSSDFQAEFERGLVGLRYVQLSNAKFRCVQIRKPKDHACSAGAAPTFVTMRTLIDPETGDWTEPEYKVSFADIRASDTFKAAGLPDKDPVFALIHPQNPVVLYFFLDDYLFAFDMRDKKLIECEAHGLGNPALLSADSVRAWELPPHYDAAPASSPAARRLSQPQKIRFRIRSPMVCCPVRDDVLVQSGVQTAVRVTSSDGADKIAKEVAKKCASCDADFSLSKRPHQCRNCHRTFCRKCSEGKIALTIDDSAPAVRVCDKCLAEINQRLNMAKEAAISSTTMQTVDGLSREFMVAPEVQLSPVRVMTRAAVNTVTRSGHNITKASHSRVALIYDARMLAHKPPKEKVFDEKPERLESIMQKLKIEGITNRCQIFESDLATTENLLTVHSTKHVKEVETLSSKSQVEMDEIALEHDNSGGTYYCQESTKAAQVAAGSVIKACDLVACKKFGYSFALVRPPGHHVGRDGPPAGFCLLNNVAIGAAHLIENYHMQKILILDWDIHHGDGTQDIFFGDKRVLFFSIHRFQEKFFPGTKSGSLDFIGDGDGVGHNINVCFKHPKIRDADYIAVWDFLLLPLIQEFKPEIILISAGFDAAQGDTLGKCEVTAAGFANLLEKLTSYPIVMTLEGGYKLTPLSECVAACVKVLLGDKPGNISKRSLPYDTTWAMIKETREKFKLFWKVYATAIPETISSRSKRYP